MRQTRFHLQEVRIPHTRVSQPPRTRSSVIHISHLVRFTALGRLCWKTLRRLSTSRSTKGTTGCLFNCALSRLSILTGDWYIDESYCNYRITRPEEHTPDLQYVTVSYCWKHSRSLEGLPKLPEYQIHGVPNSSNSRGRARRLRCPEIVFHRAVQFAKHVGCAYICIDQECIDQDDSVDIEGHLQVMHRVYSESCWTAAVLSLNAPDQHKLDALKQWIELGLDKS
ncbi:hypothetical protein FB567DRAFT_176656 [Paraphoma chrysanthemicola]|uniref:Heterokaryon incompatibility domain-containing protein n=1 Tax=Paraphoma chrysanthemicola TaxID=798071 RepID=A0A8K0RHM4_9PLEO|nr:hypothetical protein FB567DRAFT_176656 [Paraphoma chrysanthemicola]